jgi:anti-sigma regulatory factor (Ser/Thr protein kinase)
VHDKDTRSEAQSAYTAPQRHEARLPSHRTAPGAARRLVRSWLGDHPRAEDAVLAVSEVVTNAVRYGGSDGAGPSLTIRLSSVARGLRVEVDQPSLQTIEAPAGFPGPERTRGRGLAVVEALADRWGVTYGTAPRVVTTVWFELR